jgi:guanine deaminase
VLIQGRLLIDAERLPEPGWLRVEGKRISEMGQGEPPGKPDAGAADVLISPGFIDAHLHFPQFPIVGSDGLTLLDWLRHVVFPAEETWADPIIAERQARAAVQRLLRSGTLGCAAFLTSHATALAAASRALEDVPLRTIAGRVLMDREGPDALLQAPTPSFFDLPESAPARLSVAVTPRFAVSCSADALRFAGEVGRDAWVQTHLAENLAEVELVRCLFPDAPDYTTVYDAFGLLHRQTLLAHCVHLAEDEWALIAKRQSVVVHCPQANTFLQSGLFDLDQAREHDVRLALGSDIGAGCDAAMPRIARSMIDVAKLRRSTVAPKAHVPTPAEAWTLTTRGNAEALGFDDAGRLEIGAAADLLLLRPPLEIDEYLISRLLHTWEDDFIVGRLIAGRWLDSQIGPRS